MPGEKRCHEQGQQNKAKHGRMLRGGRSKSTWYLFSMRLLVVEDNEKLAASLKKGLQQEGTPSTRGSAADARTLLHDDDDYDAILLDRMRCPRMGTGSHSADRSALRGASCRS